MSWAHRTGRFCRSPPSWSRPCLSLRSQETWRRPWIRNLKRNRGGAVRAVPALQRRAAPAILRRRSCVAAGPEVQNRSPPHLGGREARRLETSVLFTNHRERLWSELGSTRPCRNPKGRPPGSTCALKQRSRPRHLQHRLTMSFQMHRGRDGGAARKALGTQRSRAQTRKRGGLSGEAGLTPATISLRRARKAEPQRAAQRRRMGRAARSRAPPGRLPLGQKELLPLPLHRSPRCPQGRRPPRAPLERARGGEPRRM